MKGQEILKMFLKNGWRKLRQKGDHVKVCKQVNGITFHQTIPLHKDLKKGLEKKLLKDMLK
jgi:predicted RNA binding protein YcfA (HicA-like mRNA interferase family)